MKICPYGGVVYLCPRPRGLDLSPRMPRPGGRTHGNPVDVGSEPNAGLDAWAPPSPPGKGGGASHNERLISLP